ncbi:ATPase, T2SS/T4P/T4SS family [Frankia sp. CiP3]|uniref:ATPase, T2SS/T4P/T4SS family n=1 Tax=Frankia sp. CiP3 TaxID=2880971 RepID=UPI001EF50DB6|nr:ATPase, T2SS/T4P/T4SS family [Frankia sp. CiP3]
MSWVPTRPDDGALGVLASVATTHVAAHLGRTGMAGASAGEERDALVEESVASFLRTEQLRRVRSDEPPLGVAEEEEIRRHARQELSPLGPLAPFLLTPTWSDIEVNGSFNVVCTDRASGRRTEFGSPFDTEEQAFEWVAQQAALAGRRFDEANPSVRCRLPGGARLHALAKVTSLVHIGCRLFLPGLDTLEGLRRASMFGDDVAALLLTAARLHEPFGVIFSGGTGAGKTTLLRAWMNAHPDPVVLDRTVTVEDEQELFLDRARFRNLVDFEAKESNIDGKGAYSMEQYLSRDLRRQTPERVALGELKPDGGVMPLLLALGQGIAQGVATTIHAPSAEDVLPRIRTYAAFGDRRTDDTTVMQTIAGTVNLVVHVARVAGQRAVVSIREYVDYRDGQVTSAELWRWNPRAGRAMRTDNDISDRLGATFVGAGIDPTVLARDTSSGTWWG